MNSLEKSRPPKTQRISAEGQGRKTYDAEYERLAAKDHGKSWVIPEREILNPGYERVNTDTQRNPLFRISEG